MRTLNSTKTDFLNLTGKMQIKSLFKFFTEDKQRQVIELSIISMKSNRLLQKQDLFKMQVSSPSVLKRIVPTNILAYLPTCEHLNRASRDRLAPCVLCRIIHTQNKLNIHIKISHVIQKFALLIVRTVLTFISLRICAD